MMNSKHLNYERHSIFTTLFFIHHFCLAIKVCRLLHYTWAYNLINVRELLFLQLNIDTFHNFHFLQSGISWVFFQKAEIEKEIHQKSHYTTF